MVLGTTGSRLMAINYYDEEGRVAKVYKQHYQSGGIALGNYDEVSSTYTFEGLLASSTRVHHNGTNANTTILNRYEYDHIGRKLRSYQQIDADSEVLLAENSYNEIGQLKARTLGNGIQNTKYAYNERGWMTKSTSGQFNVQLKYQDGTTPQFNGNISNQIWNTNSGAWNTFTYTYDKLDRLINSNHSTMKEVVTYDVMGNISSLKRGEEAVRNYLYTGNQLNSTTGVATAASYQYDGNGNATTDGRTGKAFTYNILNLPATVTGNLSYIYDAGGDKLKKISGTVTTDYIDGIQYSGNSIQLIQTEVGIARRNGTSHSYEYNLSDHLGKTRVTFYKNPGGGLEVLQSDDYYAFGLRKLVKGSSTENKYHLQWEGVTK